MLRGRIKSHSKQQYVARVCGKRSFYVTPHHRLTIKHTLDELRHSCDFDVDGEIISLLADLRVQRDRTNIGLVCYGHSSTTRMSRDRNFVHPSDRRK